MKFVKLPFITFSSNRNLRQTVLLDQTFAVSNLSIEKPYQWFSLAFAVRWMQWCFFSSSIHIDRSVYSQSTSCEQDRSDDSSQLMFLIAAFF